jgi:hypothetical protein
MTDINGIKIVNANNANTTSVKVVMNKSFRFGGQVVREALVA